ncbi:MAG: hypothetical protein CM15mP120_03280 [Pseudomonadota bacterium]|nr:MAG: hypothetical protein CM15mP120_03280 [Pseudomonadota bacterium]
MKVVHTSGSATESRRYLLSQEGNRIVALLDEQRLAEVASLSFGEYAKLSVGDDDIYRTLSTPFRPRTPPLRSNGNSILGLIKGTGLRWRCCRCACSLFAGVS